MALKDIRETIEDEFKYAAFDDAIDSAVERGMTRTEAIADYITNMQVAAAVEGGVF